MNLFSALLLGFCPLRAQSPDLTWVDRIPVIELSYDESAFNTESFIPATLLYYNSAESVSQYDCTVRHRGGSSTVFAKPSYAVKFYDSMGEKLDVSFLDMRSDNYWILDAASGDQSKMRNRVSMDLWLDFSRKPYHQAMEEKAVNGARGHFVEVYVNGSYDGVFCLMERVDRKQLKLKKFKTDAATGETYYRGLMYKAVDSNNTRTPFFYYNQESPSSDLLPLWDGMKNEYPDVTEGEPWSWNPLLTAVKKLAFKSSTFRKYMETYYDLPVFFDYVLYLDLMCALDNVGKNYFCWFYDYTSEDKRMGYTPWDMDATWGRNWAGEPMSAEREMNNRSNFHARMKESYTGYLDTLALRYTVLRHTYWDEDTLCAYFDKYFQLFDETGVIERELQRWKNTNCRINTIEEEQQFIHQWIHDRLAFMDIEYAYDPEAPYEDPVQDPDPGQDDALFEVVAPAVPTVRHNLWGQPVISDDKGWSIVEGRIQYHR